MSGVKVRLQPGVMFKSVPQTWAVTCEACAPLGVFGAMFRPWVRSKTWRGAMVLAEWHASLHAEQRCAACLHEPPIAEPEIVEGNLFRWEGRLWALEADRVVEMTEAQK